MGLADDRILGSPSHRQSTEPKRGTRPRSNSDSGLRLRQHTGAVRSRKREGQSFAHNFVFENTRQESAACVDESFVRRCTEPLPIQSKQRPWLTKDAFPWESKRPKNDSSPLNLPSGWFSACAELEMSRTKTKPLSAASLSPGTVPWNASVLIEPWERKQRERASQIPVSPPLSRRQYLPASYASPRERTAALDAELREERRKFASERQALFECVRKQLPGASKERCWAEVRRIFGDAMNYEKRRPLDPNYAVFAKPNLSLTDRGRKYREYFHTGKFDRCAIDGREAWSCCLNPNRSSRGCHERVVNPDAWRLLSPF
uniref:Uncharacterized protein n=1 Tax=Neospora caninum (strain Liverpool) TaxID=572307 RepID=A0A0F7ULV4_NEOCL|nr:TPA: hypothetical protein BN1204_056615 [Neospora caninum Liverpool]